MPIKWVTENWKDNEQAIKEIQKQLNDLTIHRNLSLDYEYRLQVDVNINALLRDLKELQRES